MVDGDINISVATLTSDYVAKTIDHSLLRPELDAAAVLDGCDLARCYSVASACVKPSDTAAAAEALRGSGVKVCTVIGFPHGSSKTEIKVYEAEWAMAEGAEELDLVLNIARLRAGASNDVRSDIQAVCEVASGRALVKVILENAYLNEDQKVLGCRLAESAGAGFVSASTGFAPTGATAEDVRLIRRTLSPETQVKASGGIDNLDTLLEMLRAGAVRIGTSATETILEEFKAREARWE
ncbi:MAG TPA: deoxyribose-phosphate aldolase [Gaiellaceae bacterium]|jgi:deoxyribose-phosphate aldolase